MPVNKPMSQRKNPKRNTLRQMEMEMQHTKTFGIHKKS